MAHLAPHMKQPRMLLGSILFTLHCLSLESLADPAPIQIQNHDVIALLGAENMVRVQQAGYLEASLTSLFHETGVQFR